MHSVDDSDGTAAGRTISTLSSREIYLNRWMRVREDEILRSTAEGIYGVVEKEDGAIILPIDEGRVWLVGQFRYTIQKQTPPPFHHQALNSTATTHHHKAMKRARIVVTTAGRKQYW